MTQDSHGVPGEFLRSISHRDVNNTRLMRPLLDHTLAASVQAYEPTFRQPWTRRSLISLRSKHLWS